MKPSVLDRPMSRRRDRVDQYVASGNPSVLPGAHSPTGYFNLELLRCYTLTHILKKIETDSNAAIAYQMNIQFFPVSNDTDLK